jgi:hypothetical protein
MRRNRPLSSATSPNDVPAARAAADCGAAQKTEVQCRGFGLHSTQRRLARYKPTLCLIVQRLRSAS